MGYLLHHNARNKQFKITYTVVHSCQKTSDLHMMWSPSI